jgi:hypothetical protein
MTNDNFDPNSQFVISYELLTLFKWLLDHEQDGLKKLIDKALRHGLDGHIGKQYTKSATHDDLQRNIVDFFMLLETILYESINEDEVSKIMQRHLLPAIDHIDSTAYDTSTLASTIAKATVTAENHPERNAKDILCKELLKRWKPKNISTN